MARKKNVLFYCDSQYYGSFFSTLQIQGRQIEYTVDQRLKRVTIILLIFCVQDLGLALQLNKTFFWLTLQRAIITKRKKPLMFIQQRTHCKLLASVLFDSGSIRLTFFCAMTKNCLCYTFVSASKTIIMLITVQIIVIAPDTHHHTHISRPLALSSIAKVSTTIERHKSLYISKTEEEAETEETN